MKYEEAYNTQKKYIELKYSEYKKIVDSYKDSMIPNDVMSRWYMIREIKLAFDEIEESYAEGSK